MIRKFTFKMRNLSQWLAQRWREGAEIQRRHKAFSDERSLQNLYWARGGL